MFPRLYVALVAAHPDLKNHEDQPRLRTYIAQAVTPLKGKTLELVRRGTSNDPDLLRRIGGTPETSENITETITRNGTKPTTETTEAEPAEEVRPDKTEDTNLSIADFSPSNEEPKHAIQPNKDDKLSRLLSTAIAEKETQIAALESDLAALKRVVQILAR
jgi:hypothetical protein